MAARRSTAAVLLPRPRLGLALVATLLPGAAAGPTGISLLPTRSVADFDEHFEGFTTTPLSERPIQRLRCGQTAAVHSGTSQEETCPEECPYFVEDKTDHEICTFRCVLATECAQWDPSTPVASSGRSDCRRCKIDGCRKCDAGEEVCSKCEVGYRLMKGGWCQFKYKVELNGLYYALIALGFVFASVVAWVIEWTNRAVVNEESLFYALKERDRRKLKKKGKLLPLTLNLLRQEVSGPGLLLHFRFQLFVIVWAFVVALVWMSFAHFVDPRLWVLGTRKFGTPRDNCISIAWGYETQQELMWTKVAFLWIVYTGTCTACFAFGVYQLRTFQEADYSQTTMRDFVACVRGVPLTSGAEDLEGQLRLAVEELCGVPCIGVSVAWDFKHAQYEVQEFLRQDEVEEAVFEPPKSGIFWHRESSLLDLNNLHLKVELDVTNSFEGLSGIGKVARGGFCQSSSSSSCSSSFDEESEEEMPELLTVRTLSIRSRAFSAALQGGSSSESADYGMEFPVAPAATGGLCGLRKYMYKMEQVIFSLPSAGDVEDASTYSIPLQDRTLSRELEPVQVREFLQNLQSSSYAFAVFNTQEDRDKALKVSEARRHRGKTGLQFVSWDCEPDTVQWHNFGHSPWHKKVGRLFLGCLSIFLANLMWAVIFDSPYAYYVLTFDYDNGNQPGTLTSLCFSMVVVVGNAIMYEVCARTSDFAGFILSDSREACYMVLYMMACCINVSFDIVVTYYISEKIVEGLGFRSYYGTPLEQITEFTAKLESFGMQRILVENAYSYAFPSTFLLPFLIEPFPTVVLPFIFGKLLVRTHPELKGDDAARWLEMFRMDLGRYGDVLLNALLAVMIFFYPGGCTWTLFLALVASHFWIYMYDQWKVLRAVPTFFYASNIIDKCAHALWAPIVGLIAACLVFKTNCRPDRQNLEGRVLVYAMLAAFFGHTVVHLFVLWGIVPVFGKKPPPHNVNPKTFAEMCADTPCSWFTANPIHCLRSKHRFLHEPSCVLYQPGKEWHLKANPKIGCYFEEDLSL